MKGIRLEPARGLLENFTHTELSRMVTRGKLDIVVPRARAALADAITRHLSLDEIVEEIHRLFPPRRGTKQPAGSVRIDQLPPLHGSATVQTYSKARPQLGRVLLGRSADCVTLSFNSAPLFLENRWPVLVHDGGTVPCSRLYAAFIRPGRIHPSAEAAPPRSRPYMLDEGEYQLRNGRLRFEFAHAGPISFQVTFLRGRPPTGRPVCVRARTGRPEYLFEPIV